MHSIGFDSLDQVDAVCEIEDKLGFDISTEEAEKIASVEDALTVFTDNCIKRPQQCKIPGSKAAPEPEKK